MVNIAFSVALSKDMDPMVYELMNYGRAGCIMVDEKKNLTVLKLCSILTLLSLALGVIQWKKRHIIMAI